MNTEAYDKMKQFCERFVWHLESMKHSLKAGDMGLSGDQMLTEAKAALASCVDEPQKIETRRHNEFGVDLTGTPENLDKAMAALNSQPTLKLGVTMAIPMLKGYFVMDKNPQGIMDCLQSGIFLSRVK